MQYRYPGTTPFSREYKDLFFGRKQDIVNLYKHIDVEKVTVLYSKSGLGKSSLVNAGLLPVFEEQNYLPVIVRFGSYSEFSANSPFEIFVQRLTPVNSDSFLNNIENEYLTVWQHIKNLQLRHIGKAGILLVFDQFEELFTYPAGIQSFAKELSEVIDNKIPRDFKRNLKLLLNENPQAIDEQQLRFIEQEINLKVVFSIRSDRMSLLNRLKPYIPTILRNCYELKPLDTAQAIEAITEPAQKDGSFVSPKFTYTPNAINRIINYLSSNNEKEIEPFQLQVICKHLEENIIISGKQTTVTENHLLDIEQISKNFYENTISKFNSTEQTQIRLFIENQLIQQERRISLDEVICTKSVPKQILSTLVDLRLLRSEPNSVGGYSYELSHDTLIAPVLAAKKIREEEDERLKAEREKAEKEKAEKEKAERERVEREKELRRQRKVILMVGSVAVVAIIAAIFAVILYFSAEKAKIEAENAKTKAVVQEQLAVQKQKEAKEALDQLKSSEFNRLEGEANQFCKELKFAEAVAKFEEAMKWTADSAALQQRIDSLMNTAGKEIQFKRLMQQATESEKAEKNWLAALEFYQQAANLDFDKQLALSKRQNLQARFNSRLVYYKTQAREYLNRGGSFKQHALSSFINPGLLLNPNDADLKRLETEARK